MTIIATDDYSSGERPDRYGEEPNRVDRATERIEATGERVEDTTRRIAAAIAGALEGFVEALDRYDLTEEGKRAIHEAGELSRAAGSEAATQAQSPEMQQLGRGIRTAGTATADAARTVGTGVRDTTVGAKDSVVGGVTSAKDAVTGKVGEVRDAMHERAENVRYAAARAKEEVRVRADAVAESGRRARVAPGRVRHEIGEAFAAWKRGFVTSLAMFLALGVFATIALIVLTIALVVGLNELIGDPAGTFVVALLYVVVAGIAFAVAKSARTRAAEERAERMENAREEVRHVARPVRDAFSRGRGI